MLALGHQLSSDVNAAALSAMILLGFPIYSNTSDKALIVSSVLFLRMGRKLQYFEKASITTNSCVQP
jgi:exopolysaccharide biosynthesis predicted pyruvyltransferase EpsI